MAPKHPARANLDSDLLAKLDKVFALMSSDNPNEAGVAALMFFKAASAKGVNLQTLRDRMAKSWMSDEDAARFRDTIAKAKETGRHEALMFRSDDFSNTDGSADWREIAKYVDRERRRLPARYQDDWWRDFINDMAARAMSSYPVRLSEKQERKLLEAFGKLGGRIT